MLSIPCLATLYILRFLTTDPVPPLREVVGEMNALMIEVKDLSGRTRGIEEEIHSAVRLRQRALKYFKEANIIGGLIGKHNPRLSQAERLAVGRAVIKHGIVKKVDPYLVAAIIIVESKGRIMARSPKGARGLMQVMPRWASPGENLFDIDKNIEIGTEILAENIRRWGYIRGIQAYFWGVMEPDGRYLAKVFKAMEEFGGNVVIVKNG